MKKSIKEFISLVIVIIWMAIVFIFSSQNGEESTNTSQGFINWVLNIVSFNNKNIVAIIEPIVRKMAHYTLYTIGGIVIFNYINKFNITTKKKVGYTLLIGSLYSITDEIHQLFVPGRTGALKDVGIDSLGVVTGIIISILIIKLWMNIMKKNVGE